MLYSGIT